MPKTLTKTARQIDAAPTGDAVTLSVPEAVARWRRWAEQIAAGEDPPAARDILDTAGLLSIENPGVALNADADVLANVKASEARVDLQRQAWREEVAAHGGAAAIQERLKELRAEIRRLEAINDPGRVMAAGHAAGEVTGTKRRNPRLFNPAYQGEKR